MSSSSSDKETDDLDTKMASVDVPASPPDFGSSSSEQQAPKDAQSATQANTGSRVNGDTKAHFGAPGSCWQTKKFHEEYERAEANLVDKTWVPTQYGDPLNNRG